MYNVHRINPQCVLTNITQLPPYWFMSAGEARSAPADPRPQALEPQHWRCAVGVSHIRMQLKKTKKTTTTFLQVERGRERAAGRGRWAVRRGWARDSVVHVQSNYKSLVNVGTTGEGEQAATAHHRVGRHTHTCTCSERREKGLSNLKC